MRPFHTAKQLAVVLEKSPETIKWWRYTGRGPKFHKPHGTETIIYFDDDIQEWLEKGAM